MPSSSKSQYRLMAAAARDKKFAEARNIDQKVAKEWHAEDKKKKEADPEWYANLPDTKDAKEKLDSSAAEVSMEGLLDNLKSLFGVQNKAFADKRTAEFEDIGKKIIKELRADSSKLTPEMLATGTIQASNAIKDLGLSNFTNNWLSDIESILKTLGTFLPHYAQIRKEYSLKVRDIYKKTETMGDPTAAANWAVPAINREKSHLIDKIKLPTLHNSIYSIVDTPEGVRFKHAKPQFVPHAIDALEYNQAMKVLKLLELVYKIQDDVWDFEEDAWCLDDTDEIKWWSHHFPDNEDYMKFINILPYAGEWYEFDIEYHPMLHKLEEGLLGLLSASIKK